MLQNSLFIVGAYILCIFALYKFIDWCIRQPRLSHNSRLNVLITGCDTGFGNLLARRLDRTGFQVFAACLTENGKEELAKHVSDKVRVFQMNVADDLSVENGLKFVKSHLSQDEGLWGLVNNAGILGASAPVEFLRKSDYLSVLEVNLLGVHQVCKTFIPLVRKSKGRIVNMTSMAGRMAGAYNGPYVASKHALEGYSDVLRMELKKYGVSVHIIEPVHFATNIFNPEKVGKCLTELWNGLSDEVKDCYGHDFVEKTKESYKVKVMPLFSTKLHEVIDTYEHALTAVFPRGRYIVGWIGRTFYWFLSISPEWLCDIFLG